MKRNGAKQAIYLRTFSALLAVYLMLMTGFSIFLVAQESKMAGMELSTFALEQNRIIKDTLQDQLDILNQIADLSKAKTELVRRASYLNWSDTEVAVFTGDDYTLLFNTNSDHWQCSYQEQGERHFTYGYLDPEDWFSEKETTELENYLYAAPKAEKAGDLSGYVIFFNGLWVDHEMIIPDKISVTPMYADTFDENGNVKSAKSAKGGEIDYTSGYQNTKNLPYFKFGFGDIRPVRNSETQIGLRKMVLDQEKLKAVAAAKPPTVVLPERVKWLTYRYYLPQPYSPAPKVVDVVGDQSNHSQFWMVYAREVNLWERCGDTLIFMWASCLVAFMIAAFILSAQTYKTDQKRAELERYRRETNNALAHDLKTPLSIISGYAQNLRENVHTEKREYYAGNIQTNVNRMDKIIREMLELSRLESNLPPLKAEDVFLAEVSGEIIERYRQVWAEKSIAIHLEGDAVVKAQRALMARVIDNFFVNALDYTPDGGTIRIRITGNTLEFYNSGSHIPEERMAELWQPYKKVDAARSNIKGTGLGLAIVRTILELHQFSYGVRNSEDGVIFWFNFN